jgi:hypothetical protein
MSAPPAVEPEEPSPRMEEIRKVNTGVDPRFPLRGDDIYCYRKVNTALDPRSLLRKGGGGDLCILIKR